MGTLSYKLTLEVREECYSDRPLGVKKYSRQFSADESWARKHLYRSIGNAIHACLEEEGDPAWAVCEIINAPTNYNFHPIFKCLSKMYANDFNGLHGHNGGIDLTVDIDVLCDGWVRDDSEKNQEQMERLATDITALGYKAILKGKLWTQSTHKRWDEED